MSDTGERVTSAVFEIGKAMQCPPPDIRLIRLTFLIVVLALCTDRRARNSAPRHSPFPPPPKKGILGSPLPLPCRMISRFFTSSARASRWKRWGGGGQEKRLGYQYM